MKIQILEKIQIEDLIHYIRENTVMRAKVKGFQTLSKKFMIHGPKDPPLKFQPSIRSESAPIKTRAEREHSINYSHSTSQPKF